MYSNVHGLVIGPPNIFARSARKQFSLPTTLKMLPLPLSFSGLGVNKQISPPACICRSYVSAAHSL